MSYKVTLIPGDGIGPEVTDAALICIDALGVAIDWEKKDAGECALNKYGQLLPEDTLASIERNKVALKGPITTPVGKGFRSVNVAIRQHFDLYVCLRPVKSLQNPQALHKDVDIIIMRENTEDLYAGVEFAAQSKEAAEVIKTINSQSDRKVRPDSAISIKPISAFGSRRIAEFALNYAVKHKRKKVTCVHKANIMKYTDGLFLDTFYEVAEKFKGKLDYNDVIVDNLSMQLVRVPKNFDILVLPNLYGDIMSDLGAGLIGGLGLAAGANIGEKIAVFEPTHGSAPKYTGKNKVNPMATILSAALMLDYLGETKKAEILTRAVSDVVGEGKDVTYDLKPHRDDPTAVGTKETALAVAHRIKELL
ncbi:MAG: isocitrate/isopropylmalate dehydrogenase family protein [Candidatus Omnitrophica bacterium]|nr:isocitrate/isopropylmalate dehydrogenase family protein [Candidatus Omnitrophota bacterium]MBU2044562.1 isocitrate/isopropylmalate dehydrogenase family protein [Candidatus Omnitrophota bacterium]MBU2251180.1 isocitrate/isopropylmalate dehydrogenase family protein [Candidatus Omnitrophota bacterium]MBU2474178.1 isocitrate/isopropylmalate dehydrogenase family protein [Candidatus Omnitrophota bacterium]